MSVKSLIDSINSEKDIDTTLQLFETLKQEATLGDLPGLYEAIAPDFVGSNNWSRELFSEVLITLAGAEALPSILKVVLKNEQEGADNDTLNFLLSEFAEMHAVETALKIEEILSSNTVGEAIKQKALWLRQFCTK